MRGHSCQGNCKTVKRELTEYIPHWKLEKVGSAGRNEGALHSTRGGESENGIPEREVCAAQAPSIAGVRLELQCSWYGFC